MDSVKKQSCRQLKKKLTPLYLLSKLKKNNHFIADKQTALSLIEREQKKINNRYGQLVHRRSSKTQANSSSYLLSYQRENVQGERQMQSKSMLSKVEQILTKSSKKGRFFSVKKERTRDSSPYLSQEKKKLEIHEEGQESIFGLRQKFMKKIKQERQQSKQPIKNLQKQRELLKTHQNTHKIFIHFVNLYKIYEIVQNKKNQKQVIPLIKSYVLQQEGDSAQIEQVYVESQVREVVKKLLFLEKVLIIVVVDLVINKKLRLAEIFVKVCFKMVFKFYRAVYKDLQKQGLIKNQLANLYQASTKILTQPQKQQKPTQNFTHIFQCLQSKMRTCFKYCRHIQKYYYQHKRQIQQFNPNLSYYRLLQFYSHSLLGSNWLSWNIQFLEVCPSPYLHHEPIRKYTLVMDLDQTLIHYKMGNAGNNYQGEFLIRPYMFEFLEQMSQFYQIGIFTCSLPEYADIIINHMKNISFRLYRHHTIRMQGEYLKDLSRIGRDLKNLIIVDNLDHNFKLQKNNGIHIRSWYGDRNDDMLRKVGNQLKKVASLNCEDLRQAQFERKFL